MFGVFDHHEQEVIAYYYIIVISLFSVVSIIRQSRQLERSWPGGGKERRSRILFFDIFEA